MMMIFGIRIEIGSRPIHHHLAQQANFRELMKRVVDGRKRHPDARRLCFGVEGLGRYVAVGPVEQ